MHTGNVLLFILLSNNELYLYFSFSSHTISTKTGTIYREKAAFSPFQKRYCDSK